VTDVEPGCAFDSGSSDAVSRSSRGSSADSTCCDRLCTNVSVVSDIVERASRRDAAAAAAAGFFNDASSSLLSPVEHLSAVFDSDSEPSHTAVHIERECQLHFDRLRLTNSAAKSSHFTRAQQPSLYELSEIIGFRSRRIVNQLLSGAIHTG